jgi:hypothetical protein
VEPKLALGDFLDEITEKRDGYVADNICIIPNINMENIS